VRLSSPSPRQELSKSLTFSASPPHTGHLILNSINLFLSLFSFSITHQPIPNMDVSYFSTKDISCFFIKPFLIKTKNKIRFFFRYLSEDVLFPFKTFLNHRKYGPRGTLYAKGINPSHNLNP
jgi:hypothetical protein